MPHLAACFSNPCFHINRIPHLLQLKVNGHVTCECKQSGKHFFTDTTAVLLTSRVTQFVSTKGESVGKAFVTYLARMHVFPCMNIKVTFQFKGT